eukprot:7987917-Alexandrium_andersonii.AAC.1
MPRRAESRAAGEAIRSTHARFLRGTGRMSLRRLTGGPTRAAQKAAHRSSTSKLRVAGYQTGPRP